MGEEDTDVDTTQVTLRLLVPSDQIGCIIGKGGQIIQGIRSDSGAQIRILKNDHLPACAISSDELLQVCCNFANRSCIYWQIKKMKIFM